MVNENNKFCECGNKLKRLYSRDQQGFKSQELFFCARCSAVYEQEFKRKKLKKLLKSKTKVLKRKRDLK